MIPGKLYKLCPHERIYYVTKSDYDAACNLELPYPGKRYLLPEDVFVLISIKDGDADIVLHVLIKDSVCVIPDLVGNLNECFEEAICLEHSD